MAFNVRIEIDVPAIRNLEHIAKADGLLQVLRMNPAWASILESRAGIREAVGSIGVEGTVLTLDQAHAITVGDETVSVGEKEKREFKAYQESLVFIRENINTSLTIGLLLRLHGIVTQGDAKANPGKIRTDLRSVERHGRIVYTAPPPDQLNFLLKEFFDWFNTAADDKTLSPVVAGAICHFWFVWIHPFADGNGRVSRLLTSFLLLKKKSEGVRYFALSDYYNQNLEGYYNALGKTNICDPKVPAMNFDGSLAPWISYFVASYYAQMESAKTVANRILQFQIRREYLREDGLITEQHDKVLAFLSGREQASYEELQQELGGVTPARVTQILKPLRDARILTEETIGKKKWFKLGAPEDEPDEGSLKRTLKRQTGDKISKGPAIQGVLPIFSKEL